MAVIDTLAVLITANTAPLDKGVKSASASVKGFAADAKGAGDGVLAFAKTFGVVDLAVRAVTEGIHLATEAVADLSKIADLSDSLGASVASLQKLEFIGAQSGVAFEELAAAISKNAVVLGDALRGNEQAGTSFKQLGLDIAKLSTQGPEERLKTYANALEKLATPAERASAAQDLFGKGGPRLIRALKGGSAAIDEQIKRVEALGIVEEKGVRNVQALGDTFDSLAVALKITARVFVADIAPAINTLALGLEKLFAFQRKLPVLFQIGGPIRQIGLIFDQLFGTEAPIAPAISKEVEAIVKQLQLAEPELEKALEATKKLRDEFSKKAIEGGFGDLVTKGVEDIGREATIALEKLRAGAGGLNKEIEEADRRRVILEARIAEGEPGLEGRLRGQQERLKALREELADLPDLARRTKELIEFEAIRLKQQSELADIARKFNAENRGALDRAEDILAPIEKLVEFTKLEGGLIQSLTNADTFARGLAKSFGSFLDTVLADDPESLTGIIDQAAERFRRVAKTAFDKGLISEDKLKSIDRLLGDIADDKMRKLAGATEKVADQAVKFPEAIVAGSAAANELIERARRERLGGKSGRTLELEQVERIKALTAERLVIEQKITETLLDRIAKGGPKLVGPAFGPADLAPPVPAVVEEEKQRVIRRTAEQEILKAQKDQQAAIEGIVESKQRVITRLEVEKQREEELRRIRQEALKEADAQQEQFRRQSKEQTEKFFRDLSPPAQQRFEQRLPTRSEIEFQRVRDEQRRIRQQQAAPTSIQDIIDQQLRAIEEQQRNRQRVPTRGEIQTGPPGAAADTLKDIDTGIQTLIVEFQSLRRTEEDAAREQKKNTPSMFSLSVPPGP